MDEGEHGYKRRAITTKMKRLAAEGKSVEEIAKHMGYTLRSVKAVLDGQECNLTRMTERRKLREETIARLIKEGKSATEITKETIYCTDQVTEFVRQNPEYNEILVRKLSTGTRPHLEQRNKEICEKKAAGQKATDLAKEYKLSLPNIYKILTLNQKPE